MSSINCERLSRECPYHAKITVEHESAELRLKKELVKRLHPEQPAEDSNRTIRQRLMPFADSATWHGMLALLFNKGNNLGSAYMKGVTFGIFDNLLTSGIERFKWKLIDPKKLSEMSIGELHAKSALSTITDTTIKLVSLQAVNSFLGLFNSPLERGHIYFQIIPQVITMGINIGYNSTKFIQAKRTLAKFDEMNHLYHHFAAQGKEYTEKPDSLNEAMQKSLNEALKVAALRKLMGDASQALIKETATQDLADDIVDVRIAARITSFLAAIKPLPKKPQIRKVELGNGSLSVEWSASKA